MLRVSDKSRWISHPEESTFCAFKREFELHESLKTTVTVTADQRYILYLDGKRIGRGSERGDIDNWYAEEYKLDLEKGKHILSALIWCLPIERCPQAQISIVQ